MGTNKRYARAIDQRMDARIVERIAREGGPLQSLSNAELELDRLPWTRDPKPKPVRAWVRFGPTPVLVDAEVCGWTEHAVAVRFTIAGNEFRAWVWASAVRERPTAQP